MKIECLFWTSTVYFRNDDQKEMVLNFAPYIISRPLKDRCIY